MMLSELHQLNDGFVNKETPISLKLTGFSFARTQQKAREAENPPGFLL